MLIFDHAVRHRLPGEEDRPGQRQPVARVHVDQIPAAGIARVRRHMRDEADALLKGRAQIINVGRPIQRPVLDHPLALWDWHSVDKADLVATDLVHPDYRGEIYLTVPKPCHRWHDLSAMQPDEVLLIKCFDNATDGRARLTPHTAFADPTTPADALPRRSRSAPARGPTGRQAACLAAVSRFRSRTAAGVEDAGFWPVISSPSSTTRGPMSSPLV